MEKFSGAHALMRSLLAQGVDTIFGYPGGAIMPVYDALYDYRESLRHILVRHEQGATHAAEGYSKVAKKAGVVLVTSGPGATNLVTGIADAMMDSIPLVCITGQVAQKALGTDAFQETDVIGITIPITKWNYQIVSAAEIPLIIAKAFYVAQTGRPGPVVIDITKNAQVEVAEFETFKPSLSVAMPRRRLEPQTPSDHALQRASELIASSKRPLILAGHGVLISKAAEELKAFAEKSGIPVALTLHGLSCFPSRHPLCVGMLGMHGNYGPNLLTNSADLLIAVGMRFDDRVTGDLSTYATRARVIHIEIDPAEVGKNVPVEVALVTDAKAALQGLIPLVKRGSYDSWIGEFQKCSDQEISKVISTAIDPKEGLIKMSEVIHHLSEQSKGQAVIVADVGQHQMMAARYYRYALPDSWITSGGLGTMGFALPAALGACVGRPDRQVVAVIGDGCFQMTLQELGTIAQEKLPVKVVILNNHFLGMVRQWQELFFDNRYSFVHMESPDFVKLCDAYGIAAERISERSDLEGALERMLSYQGSFVLEVSVETEQNVFPMVPAGCGVSDIRLE
jgi:acetolactate synthase I/II/III large subunit